MGGPAPGHDPHDELGSQDDAGQNGRSEGTHRWPANHVETGRSGSPAAVLDPVSALSHSKHALGSNAAHCPLENAEI